MEENAGRGRNPLSQAVSGGRAAIVWQVAQRIFQDRVSLIAAGVAFYFLLSIFPALGAYVAIFGYLIDPTKISDLFSAVDDIVPAGGLTLIENQLTVLASQDKNKLSFGFAVAFLIAFWSANNGVKALFQALNIAHGVSEKRSFIHINLLAFAFTLGSMIVSALLISFVGIVPAILSLFDLPGTAGIAIDALRWMVLLLLSGAAISVIYRYGPSRNPVKWRWISWGSCLATLVWIGASSGFSYYLQNFANYNATYGSLGAVIGFLLWIWLSTVIIIIGAEIDAEIEQQAILRRD